MSYKYFKPIGIRYLFKKNQASKANNYFDFIDQIVPFNNTYLPEEFTNPYDKFTITSHLEDGTAVLYIQSHSNSDSIKKINITPFIKILVPYTTQVELLHSHIPLQPREIIDKGFVVLPQVFENYTYEESMLESSIKFYEQQGEYLDNNTNWLAYARGEKVCPNQEEQFKLFNIVNAVNLAKLSLMELKKVREDYKKNYDEYDTSGSWF